MKIFKSKISQFIVIGLIALIIIITSVCISNITKDKPVRVKNKFKLESIYDNGSKNIGYKIAYALCFPFNIFGNGASDYVVDGMGATGGLNSGGSSIDSVTSSGTSSNKSEGNNLDYSKTNVQVENVDEADIIKTDGNYTYSISENEVIITDVRDVNNPVVVNRISSGDSVPVDIMLYDNYLVVINKEIKNISNIIYKFYGGREYDTDVKIYDISNKLSVSQVKSFKLNQNYYTARIVNGKLYIISNGRLREKDDEVIAYYEEDNNRIDIDLDRMYYFKDKPSNYETVISYVDLNNLNNSSFELEAYLSDVDYVYVSENNIYIADKNYEYDEIFSIISKLFGWTGIWGFEEDVYDFDTGYVTNIMKLQMNEDGSIKYIGKAEVRGEAVNQFSFDEYDSNLRVAIEDGDKGSKIVVFNEKMKKIGESDYVGEDENMYSSRFAGEKAYLVTYKNMDPLFVFDLSDPKNPKVLGELEIPGYSTYLHPYDENHIIGIGIQTEQRIIRDSQGNVLNTSTYVTGMKMALFDVSDVNSPKQISEVTIGDRYTKSAILTNHKALLFSKEKGIIAIPVNSYTEEIEEEKATSDSMDSLVKSYNTTQNYISEGYLVYNINLDEGIKLKGVITHNEANNNSAYKTSQLLRGVYIKDNLITISQHMLKVNNLNTLEEVSSIGI